MKVWSDVSTIFKLAMICLLVGFVAGFCSSAATAGGVERPRPSTPATSPAAGAGSAEPALH